MQEAQSLNQSPLFRTSAKPAEKEGDLRRLKRSTIVVAGQEYHRDTHGKMHQNFPATDFVSRLEISRSGSLNIKTLKQTSFVEFVSSVDPNVARSTNSKGVCASGSNLDEETRNNGVREANSTNFIYERKVSLRGVPKQYM